MRLLHLADAHLDAPYSGRSPAVRAALQQGCREALTRAVRLAIDEGVHAVVVAGDLFDGARLSFATERFLTSAFGELADHGIPVVLAAGNHDPGSGPRPAGSLPWPDNVTTVASSRPVRRLIHDRGGGEVGAITAAGHEGPRVSQDLAAGFPLPEGDLPEVAVLHAQVVGSRGSEDHHNYAPTELETLLRSGYHYWALGHVHQRQILSRSPTVAYPGSLQGRTSAETGPRGGLLVDLSDAAAPVVAFRPLSPIRWETLRLSGLEKEATLDDLLARIEGAWKDARQADPGEPGTRWMVQLRLSGGSPLWRGLRDGEDRRTLEEEAARIMGALDVEARTHRVGPPVDPSRLRDRMDVLGEALRILELIRGGEEVLAVQPGELASYDPERHGAPADHVRRLLADTDREMVVRMLAPGNEAE